MALDAFAKMDANQKAAVAKLQRLISNCNMAIAEAAATGIEVEIGSIEVTSLGEPARVHRITASVKWPDFQIA
jgi:hypothetical protein